MKKTVLAAILSGLLLVSLTLAGGPVSAGSEMSDQRAGDYYLKFACKANRAAQKFSDGVWHGRASITAPEVRRRLPALKRLSHAYGVALYDYAKALDKPPADWPQSVRSPVTMVKRITLQASNIRLNQGGASSGGYWLRQNARANNLRSISQFATKIRFKLDLPPRGEGC